MSTIAREPPIGASARPFPRSRGKGFVVGRVVVEPRGSTSLAAVLEHGGRRPSPFPWNGGKGAAAPIGGSRGLFRRVIESGSSPLQLTIDGPVPRATQHSRVVRQHADRVSFRDADDPLVRSLRALERNRHDHLGLPVPASNRVGMCQCAWGSIGVVVRAVDPAYASLWAIRGTKNRHGLRSRRRRSGNDASITRTPARYNSIIVNKKCSQMANMHRLYPSTCPKRHQFTSGTREYA